jgi:hypothetical protein
MNEFHLYSSKSQYYTDPLSNEQKSFYIPVAPKEHNVFFRNQNGKLSWESENSGLDEFGNSRALLTVDIDLDGDLDLVVNNYHGASMVYRNNLPAPSTSSTRILLQGNPEHGVNLDAIGAQVIAHLSNGNTIWREIRGGGGYMSVQPKAIHLGQPPADIKQIEVIWPNGEKQITTGPFTERLVSISYEP